MLAFTDFGGGLRTEEVFSSRITLIKYYSVKSYIFNYVIYSFGYKFHIFDFLLFSSPFHKETLFREIGRSSWRAAAVGELGLPVWRYWILENVECQRSAGPGSLVACRPNPFAKEEFLYWPPSLRLASMSMTMKRHDFVTWDDHLEKRARLNHERVYPIDEIVPELAFILNKCVPRKEQCPPVEVQCNVIPEFAFLIRQQNQRRSNEPDDSKAKVYSISSGSTLQSIQGIFPITKTPTAVRADAPKKPKWVEEFEHSFNEVNLLSPSPFYLNICRLLAGKHVYEP